MDELVAKDVEPVEDEAQDEDGVPHLQGSPEAALRGPEPFFPVFEPGQSIVVLPERVEYIPVVQEHADGSREVVPDRVVDPLTGIEGHDPSKEIVEGVPLGWRRGLELLFVRIGGVEPDPEEDEEGVVVARVFGSSDPAYRPMHAQSHRFRKPGAELALLWPSGWRGSEAFAWIIHFAEAGSRGVHVPGRANPPPCHSPHRESAKGGFVAL